MCQSSCEAECLCWERGRAQGHEDPNTKAITTIEALAKHIARLEHKLEIICLVAKGEE